MKVLFVGEGSTDIGPSQVGIDVRVARGPVPILVRKICPVIGESIALPWQHISRLDPAACKSGYEFKVVGAILLSVKRYGCDGTICVADYDEDRGRLGRLNHGKAGGLTAAGVFHRIACGVAVNSTEAWSLADPDAIAAVVDVDVKEVRRLYPHFRVEELYENSGKEEHRPKLLLQRIADLRHRRADTEFREEIAVHTDIGKLQAACPGFRTFADDLRTAFAT